MCVCARVLAGVCMCFCLYAYASVVLLMVAWCGYLFLFLLLLLPVLPFQRDARDTLEHLAFLPPGMSAQLFPGFTPSHELE